MDNKQFINMCNKYGICLSDEEVKSFELYYNYLVEENNKYNLTSIIDKEEVYKKHFLDSILGISLIKNNSKVLDIGCGAGFPSIPLKIINSSLEFTLIDSVNKKVNFVNNVIEMLKLSYISAIHTRCEDCAKSPKYRESYDYVVSRAVASCNILLEYCIPFLKIGGKCIMYKGINYKEEIELIKNAMMKLKCKLIDIKEVFVDELNTTRVFLIFEKFDKTPTQYPRLQNKVRKQPL